MDQPCAASNAAMRDPLLFILRSAQRNRKPFLRADAAERRSRLLAGRAKPRQHADEAQDDQGHCAERDRQGQEELPGGPEHPASAHRHVGDALAVHPQVPDGHASHPLPDHAGMASKREAPLAFKIGEDVPAGCDHLAPHRAAVHTHLPGRLADQPKATGEELLTSDRDQVVTIIEFDQPGVWLGERCHPLIKRPARVPVQEPTLRHASSGRAHSTPRYRNHHVTWCGAGRTRSTSPAGPRRRGLRRAGR
jgi:hypothetical protein